jgi:hypothetical protein
MKKILRVLVPAVLLLIAPVFAQAATKTYQVTGPVLEVTDSMIAVQKGKDRWEIARDASTKVTGDLKVGSKVMIEYRMTATTVENKDANVKEPAKKK